MTHHKTTTVHVNRNGEFHKSDAATWLAGVLLLGAGVFAAAMADMDFDSVESYGLQNESINVWRHLTLGWVVDWWDTDSRVMLITVDDPCTYAAFQVKWIAPMALKIMAADKALLREGKAAHKALRREASLKAGAEASKRDELASQVRREYYSGL
jgi:hypothetical protein